MPQRGAAAPALRLLMRSDRRCRPDESPSRVRSYLRPHTCKGGSMTKLHDILESYVANGTVPGAVGLVARGDRVEGQAVGWAWGQRAPPRAGAPPCAPA